MSIVDKVINYLFDEDGEVDEPRLKCLECLNRIYSRESLYIKLHFKERNGVVFTPIKDVHYTPLCLTFMSSPKVSDSITQRIIPEFGIYRVIEICGGLGGNTMSFLSKENVSQVITYEADPLRYLMLHNNVLSYGLRHKSVLRGKFKLYDLLVGDELYNSIVYIDPPWSKEDKCVCKVSYIKSGIKIGEYDLETIVSTLLSKCVKVAIKLPKRYTMKRIPSAVLSVMKMKKMDVFIYSPKRV